MKLHPDSPVISGESPIGCHLEFEPFLSSNHLGLLVYDRSDFRKVYGTKVNSVAGASRFGPKSG